MHPQTEALKQRYAPEGSELRTLQLNMLDILSFVDDVCRRHNLSYWLSGGTLLGAVVHDGFIPWDDDIDIEMMRDDYKKLLQILKTELPGRLYLQTPKEKGYSLLHTKIRDRNSIVYMKDEDMSGYSVKGFFIDIVPVEPSYMWIKKGLDAIYGRAFRRFKRGSQKSLKGMFDYLVSILLYPVSCLLVGVARIICRITKPKSLVYTYGINAKHAQKIDTILPTSRILFEDREFLAPNKPDEYLLTQYKCDYTVIPPESDRPQHFKKIEFL